MWLSALKSEVLEAFRAGSFSSGTSSGREEARSVGRALGHGSDISGSSAWEAEVNENESHD